MSQLHKIDRRQVLLMGMAALAYCTMMPRPSLAASTEIGPIRCVDGYRRALALAGSRNAFAIVDVGATWCQFCKTLDEEIFTDPRIEKMLTQFALLRVDVTAWDSDNLALVDHLAVQGPPTVFVIDTSTGREIAGTRSLGSFDVANLASRLRPLIRP
jgi:thiol:disulfide interchange protein DsbD